MKLSPLFLAGLLAIASAASAADLPNLGESDRAYLSHRQEQALGAAIMRDIHEDPRYVNDPQIEAYINELGYRLVANSPENTQAFRFFVLRDPTINAFAMPGGFIGIHTGTILAAQDESELAAVLAHEIGHVVQHHVARSIAEQSRSLWPTLAAMALGLLAARSNPDIAGAAITGAQAAAVQNQLAHSREHEEEADRIGFEILVKAGFDPHDMVAFFRRLQRENQLYGYNAPVYLRDHPLTSERIADMAARADRLPYKQVLSTEDFYLVRARIRAQEDSPQGALTYFRGVVDDKRYSRAEAALYGLAVAYLRSGQPARAQAPAQQAAHLARSPMLDMLLARIAAALGRTQQAATLYRHGLDLYPNYHPLAYAYAALLIDQKQPAEAMNFLQPLLQARPDDAELWRLAAHSYAFQGKTLASHQAQAEALALDGNYRAAIEQIDLGLKSEQGDFYAVSVAEAKKRQWRALLAEQQASLK